MIGITHAFTEGSQTVLTELPKEAIRGTSQA
jgi:hypothetical protein